MSQQVTASTPTDRRLLLLPRPLPASAPARPGLGGAGQAASGAERLDRREALLHRLELDRQRRRYRSA